jgi:hypothetical protein
MTNKKLDEGIAQYVQPKPEGDIDLIKEVRDSMLAAGLHNAVYAGFDTNRFIIEAQGKNSAAQRFLLNRFWTLQLMSSVRPSTEERYCLIPNGTVQDWLRLFKAKVLPFVIENNLPVKI